MARKQNPNAGISRIDQDHKRTHGFFVRLCRKGKIHNAFFADKSCGGRQKALKLAREHYQKLLKQHGTITRKDRARMKRRPGTSGIVGVRKITVARGRAVSKYWMAKWTPRPGESRQKLFSVNKYGEKRAKELAVKARTAGVRSMEE